VVARLVLQLRGREVKPPIKGLLIVLSAAVASSLLTWTGAFLYWHHRINRDLRAIEHHTANMREETADQCRKASQDLTLAGCRAVPYLIAAMDPSKHAQFLRGTSTIVATQSTDAEARRTGRRTNEHMLRLHEWIIMPWDPVGEQRRKIDLMGTWWDEHRREYHPWWEVWSTKCDGYPVGD
jgi:hypothetical protein